MGLLSRHYEKANFESESEQHLCALVEAVYAVKSSLHSDWHS